MAVDCAVDEKEIGRFTQLLHEPGSLKDSTFTLILPDQTLYPYPGHLSVLDRAVDAQTGTLRVRLIFPNPGRFLRPGLTCDLRMRIVSPSGDLLIPYRAVVEQMGEYFAYVLNGKTVSQRRLSLGMRVHDMVVVSGGLRAGDQIVTDGVQRLRDNAPVTVIAPLANGAPEFSQGKQPGQVTR